MNSLTNIEREINNIILESDNFTNIIFLKGITKEIYFNQKYIDQKINNLFIDNDKLDILKLNKNIKKITKELINLEDKTIILPYEIYIIFKNISNLVDANIFVIDNKYIANIDLKYTNSYQTILEESQLNLLLEYHQSDLETTLENETMNILNEYYTYAKEDNEILVSYEELDNEEINYINIVNNKLANEKLNNKQTLETISDNDIVPTTNIDKKALLKILKSQYGKDAKFREFDFYIDPNINKDTKTISQLDLITQICNSSINALNNNLYNDNLNVIATGSGKSLLYQIASKYLYDNHKDKPLTIVISPLISIMEDQHQKLKNEFNQTGISRLNSNVSYNEKLEILQKIKNDQMHLLYVSPEYFNQMANYLEGHIDQRKIGLIVVDEAHLVSSWGKEFRCDYWLLGKTIDKLRNAKKSTQSFSVLTLTATAVNGGVENSLNDITNELYLETPNINYGKVNRDNISFDIRKDNIFNKSKEYKINITKDKIKEFIAKDEKSIIYFPIVRQINYLYDSLDEDIKPYVSKYFGSLSKDEKQIALNSLKDGTKKILLCTKAFGMGVDIKGIKNVYHFALTGGILDYLQEIGRTARDNNIKGCASIDFTINDFAEVRKLGAFGGINNFSIRKIANHICEKYEKTKKRNMVVSPEDFSWLFNSYNVEMKTKSCLLNIMSDLNTCGFPAFIMSPKTYYGTQYILVPSEIDKKFNQLYKDYIKGGLYQTKNPKIASYTGKMYEVDFKKLWEEKFNDMTYQAFQAKFFNKEIFKTDFSESVIPKKRLTIELNKTYADTKLQFEKILIGFRHLVKKLPKNYFSKTKFVEIFKESFEDINTNEDTAKLILEHLIMNSKVKCNYSFITTRNINGKIYYKMDNKRNSFYRNLKSEFNVLQNVNQNNKFITFITQHRDKKVNSLVFLASVLKIFNLGTYELKGGKNNQIFVRVNDPLKIKAIANKNYKSKTLSQTIKKKNHSIEVLKTFLTLNISDEERRDSIEDYFLGYIKDFSHLLNKDSNECKTSFDNNKKDEMNKIAI